MKSRPQEIVEHRVLVDREENKIIKNVNLRVCPAPVLVLIHIPVQVQVPVLVQAHRVHRKTREKASRKKRVWTKSHHNSRKKDHRVEETWLRKVIGITKNTRDGKSRIIEEEAIKITIIIGRITETTITEMITETITETTTITATTTEEMTTEEMTTITIETMTTTTTTTTEMTITIGDLIKTTEEEVIIITIVTTGEDTITTEVDLITITTGTTTIGMTETGAKIGEEMRSPIVEGCGTPLKTENREVKTPNKVPSCSQQKCQRHTTNNLIIEHICLSNIQIYYNI